MSTERSIAEIVGGSFRLNGTVDDMLAWLHDTENDRHGWQVHYLGPRQPIGGWEVGIYPWGDNLPYETHGADTLHAALVAAVRAVAAGEEAAND